ncbi:Adenylate cyclase 2 [Geobacteraceae bacterium]|nr:Adenylate cyclase 2 [Geobacteraceae bacterium]
MGTGSELLEKEELVTLVECGRELAAEVGLTTLLKTILDKASVLTDSPDASVILHSEKRGTLYFAHAVGDDADLLLKQWGESAEQGIPLRSKAGEVFSTGRSLVENALADDANHFKGVDGDTKRPTASMICVPLAVAGRPMGVVQILNKRSGGYTERDRVLLEHFAAQAAVAIRNARLIEELLAHMGFYAYRDDTRGPTELIDELNSPAHRETITILFADMRGFTQLCQIFGSPEDTQRILNDFLAMLAEAVFAHRGIVNKFLGDGVLAFFRGEEQALNAVRCAFTMLANFGGMRDAWDAQTNAPLGFLDVGVGIATDTVILGCVGSERAKEFTAIGVGVILAANLMSHARNGRRILVDKRTFNAVRQAVAEYEGPEQFELKKPGETTGNLFERYLVKSLAAGSGVAMPAIPIAPKTGGGEVFISYSHKDGEWLTRLKTHLKPYIHGETLAVWDDTKIKPGERWRDEITAALEHATVAVVLVSPNFLESDFIASSELPPLLAAARERGLTILWVPLSFSSYDETEIRDYQAAINPDRPIDTLSKAEQNKAWVKVCKRIKEAVQG